MKKCIFLAFSLLFLFACGGNKAPDVSNIKVDLQFIRFDKALADLKKDTVSFTSYQNLRKKYPDFTDLYFQRIARIVNEQEKDSAAIPYIQGFLFDKAVQELFADVDKQYNSTDDLEKEIVRAFKYYKYYLPKKAIPKIYFGNYSYNISAAAITDSVMYVSLDQYLGKDYKFYEGEYDYLVYRKAKPYLVTDVMKCWIDAEFDTGQPRLDMLDEMVFNGKVMYLVDKVLPFTHDSIKFAFTDDQVKFCNESEFMMWSFFLEKKLLYTKDVKLINKYCGESPISAGMPERAPGRTGIWLGWKIVTAFMKNNPNITIEQLMMNNNAKQILNSSRYKPKK